MPDPEKPRPHVVTSFDDLMQIYGKRMTAEIQRLHINVLTAKNVIVDAGIGYVQCAPGLKPIGIYCEAASVDSWPALATILTPDRIAWLHAAGYNDPGREPNYWKYYPSDRFKEEVVAREVLEILYQVYGFRGPHALKIIAH